MKKIFDKGLVIFKNKKLVDFFTQAETWSEKIGLFCLYLGMPLLGIAFCIEYENAVDKMFGEPAAVAAGFFVACILLGYVADKMLEYVRPSINQAKTYIVNGAFFDVLAFLFGIITLLSGFAGIVLLFSGDIQNSITALAVCGLTLYCVTMLMSPNKMLNVNVQESATPAQSLISLTAFLIKAAYRMVPFAFGALMLVVLVNGIDLTFYTHSISPYRLMEYITLFGVTALLPLIGYFLFLTYYFILDLCMSLFRIADAVEGKHTTK